MTTRANVPCNGCRTCCINDMIVLHPEKGDDPSQYQTVPITHPFSGKPVLMLAHKPNGECIYLGPDGCTIHDRAPLVCRQYDCRKLFLHFTRAERRQLVRAGILDQGRLDEGRKRLHTLPENER